MKWQTFDWTEKFQLLKIPTDPRYCERVTSISERVTKCTIKNNNKTNLMFNSWAFCIYQINQI